MIATCPSCSTRFSIPDAILGGAGKKVRCSKCGHKWMQSLPPPEASGKAQGKGAGKKTKRKTPKAPPMSDDATPRDAFAGAPPSIPQLPPTMSIAADMHPPHFPAFGADKGDLFGDLDRDHLGHGPDRDHWDGDHDAEPPQGVLVRIKKAWHWIAFAAGLASLVSVMVLSRNAVVTAWPAANRLYSNLGLPVEPPGAGLQFQAVKSEQRMDDGTVVLTVEGQITNTSEVERDVPPVRATSYGPDHHMVRSWNIPVPLSHLAPGAIATFRSVERDPGVISEVGVGF